MTDARPWLIALAGVLGYDVLRIHAGKPSLSELAGRHPVVTISALTYLTLHLLSRPRCLHRLDVLSHAAKRVPRRAA